MEYGLIGYPLKHSFSKEIHHLIDSYTYDLVELEDSKFDAFMEKKNFKAINVTIPYKQRVIPYLDVIDPAAKDIGAVNTIVNKEGKLYGYNTDYLGLIALMNKNNISLENKKCLILGTGGTSKTAAYVCKALNAKEVVKASRKPSDGVISYEDIEGYAPEVIINTTPVGMYPHVDESPLKEYPTSLDAIVDVIYNPLKTNLTKGFDKEKCNGLYMLVAQAYYASNFFVGKEHDIALLENAYHVIKKEKENIVLIGMPSCGKTTISSLLSKEIGKEVIDTDVEIIKRIGMPIKDYFEQFGEEAFRKIEKEVVKEVSLKNNIIISTGGGVIKDRENMHYLSYNGKIIFINRSLENLTPTTDRPLSSDIENLKKRYEERLPLYKQYADIEIENNSSIEEVMDVLKELV